jgi:hypothetical protein
MYEGMMWSSFDRSTDGEIKLGGIRERHESNNFFDSLTISDSDGGNNHYVAKDPYYADIFNDSGPQRCLEAAVNPASTQDLCAKIPRGNYEIFIIHREVGMFKIKLVLSTPDGTDLCLASSVNRLSKRNCIAFTSDKALYGKLSRNFVGSKYRFEGEFNQLLPLLQVDFESRIASNAEDLGPCRRFSATVFPKGSDYVNKEAPSIQLNQAPVTTTCESFDIFSDSFVTSMRFSSLDAVKKSTGYCLDFETSKPVVPSVKNFVLVNVLGERVLSMCKTGRDEFELRVWGGFICPLHAFAIAVSSIDRKLCTQ